MITKDDLLVAAHGHLQRTEPVGGSIDHVFAELDVDGSEFRGLGFELQTQRNPYDVELYDAGLVDGFVLGVRAVREEARRLAVEADDS